MTIIGYERVSTKEQDHALQHEALVKRGCTVFHTDKITGKKTKREGLDKCLAELKPGDTLVVWRLDRLGRRLVHLVNLFESFKERSISFVSIMENFDTSTAAGRAMLSMMMVFAQMEREINSERVTAGLAIRKAEGGKLGPPFKITDDKVDRIYLLDNEGASQSEIALEVGISQASVSRVLRDKK